MEHYIGLDVSSKETFICVIDKNGKILREENEEQASAALLDFADKWDAI
jgi:predicted NBD/HSP70 family sugar kinase